MRHLGKRGARNLEHKLRSPDGDTEASHAVGKLARAQSGKRNWLISHPILSWLVRGDLAGHAQQECHDAFDIIHMKADLDRAAFSGYQTQE